MKPPRKCKKLIVYGDRTEFAIPVAFKGSDHAVAWFWDHPGINALKNATEYVRWKNKRKV